MTTPTNEPGGTAEQTTPVRFNQRGSRIALFGLRTLVALIFLWHGVPKTLDWSAAREKFVDFGLPALLGPVTGIAEVVAALMLLVGLFHRPASAVLGLVIIGAITTVQIPRGIQAGLERDLLILAAIAVIVTLGPGAYVLGKSNNG